MKRVFGFTTLCLLIVGLLIGAGFASAAPWKFGVMSDTQWTPTDLANPPQNPNGVAVSIINQVNQQFIMHGVKFVIQVGDLTENGDDPDIATRAQAAQQLYLAGIGFFPMRGNHEYGAGAGNNYIFTFDGPRVTVEYFADDHGNWASDDCYPDGTTPQSCTTSGSHITPASNFVKKETWGYSLNGQEFLIPQGLTYTSVVDSFETTVARILGGKNGSIAQDYTSRPLTKAVNTGWTDVATWRNEFFQRWLKKSEFDFASNVLTLWGMADLGMNDQTDVYTLSMTYDGIPLYGKGDFGIATKNEGGKWVNAVDMNIGSSSSKKFVVGPWKPEYGLGTYGIDLKAGAAWAVIDYNDDFAVGRFEK